MSFGVEMQYEITFNLQQTAALSAAIACWEKQNDKIKDLLISSQMMKSDEVECQWNHLTQLVVTESNQSMLPFALKGDFIHIVHEIGRKILNWFKYISYETNLTYQEAWNYIDNIYWTPHGTIDEVKTFKLSWLGNPNISITKVYHNACKYALEQDVDQLWLTMSKLTLTDSFNDHSYKYDDRQILAYWRYLRDNDLSSFKECFEKPSNNAIPHNINNILYYDHSGSPELNMLRLSVQKGYRIATKHFWEKLTEEERNSNLPACTRIAIIYYANCEHKKDKFHYKNEHYIEICMFLLNQMTEDQRKTFYTEELGSLTLDRLIYDDAAVQSLVLRMMLFVWPWQELFPSVLNEMLMSPELGSKTVQMCLDEIINKITDQHYLDSSVASNKYHRLFHEVWLLIPGPMKQAMILEHPKCDFISKLLDIQDLSSIQLIMNDPEVAAVKEKYLESAQESYRLLIVRGEYEVLNQFMEAVFTSEEEKTCFKTRINSWGDSILYEQFHLANSFLNWQWNTPEKLPYIKNIINHINLCELFIKARRWDLVDMFLNWACVTEEERNKYKDYCRNNIFLKCKWKKYAKKRTDM